MEVHASPAELPELQELLGAFQVRFRRPEGWEALERSMAGLLTELPNKHCDTIAQAVPGTSAQPLQEFLTNMDWEEEALNRQRVQKMIAEATTGDGVLVFDDTGFPKRGTTSVGVARQYSGTLGKVRTCQIAVTCCYTDRRAIWPVAVRVYLPKSWADEPVRWQQARVPTAVTFQTKPEIALALLDQARAWGVPQRCVVADADYGDNPNFLGGWRLGKNRMWGRCERTAPCVWEAPRPARRGGWTSCSRVCRAGNGARCAGGEAPQAGGASSVWRGAAGG